MDTPDTCNIWHKTKNELKKKKKKKKTTQKTRMMSKKDHTKEMWVNSGEKPAILIIDKPGLSLVSDRGKKKSYIKRESPLSLMDIS
jgi:hypothetical protein